MLRATIACLLLAVCLAAAEHESAAPETPAPRPRFTVADPPGAFFFDAFNSANDAVDSGAWMKRWVRSSNPKFAEGEWKRTNGFKGSQVPEDYGLVVKGAAKHHAISTLFSKPLEPPGDKPLVIQYSVKFHQPLECGGSYIKLLATGFEPTSFTNETPYVIMFGPDKCGATNKVHFIFRHQNAKSLKWEEKHANKVPIVPNDDLSHLYTLVVYPDNSFEIFIDQKSQSKGSLLDDFTPPVNPPAEIDDPEDKMPLDWVTAAKIPDPNAVKPDDWDEDAPAAIDDPNAKKPEGWLDDEPKQIPDPEAEKPVDWDDETDGVFEPPLVPNPKCSIGCGEWRPPRIPNPKYRGKWTPPLIDNPAYKGEWKPRQIPNPEYVIDEHPNKFASMGGIGIEIWSMQEDMEFDNLYIGFDYDEAKGPAASAWVNKHHLEEENKIKLEAEAAANSASGLLGSLSYYYDKYPALVIVLGLVAAVLVVLALSFMCVKPPAGPPPPTAAAAAAFSEEDDKDSDDTKGKEKEKEPKPTAAAEAPTSPANAVSPSNATAGLKQRKPKPPRT